MNLPPIFWHVVDELTQDRMWALVRQNDQATLFVHNEQYLFEFENHTWTVEQKNRSKNMMNEYVGLATG